MSAAITTAVRLSLILAGAIFSGSLCAAPLTSFTEANGCKLFANENTVKRLKEIAANGRVVWEGQCKGGLIEGAGVLRQEATEKAGGRTKTSVVLYSGTAQKGLRQGSWRRESLDRFTDSTTFYTSAATVHFVDGVAKGKPALIAISSLDQLTPSFRKIVIDAQRDATPANAALRVSPPATSASGGAPSVTAPRRPLSEYFPRVTASSQFEQFGPDGLMTFQRPGWLSAKSPAYPQWLLVDLRANRDVKTIGIQVEEGQQPRAPKQVRIESSADAKAWNAAGDYELACASFADGNWVNQALRDAMNARYLRISILANCGDPDHVTARGLRFY